MGNGRWKHRTAPTSYSTRAMNTNRSFLRRAALVTGAMSMLASVGGVFAQTMAGDLDLEAVEKRAHDGAVAAAEFVQGVLNRQKAIDPKMRGDAQDVVERGNRALMVAADKAQPGQVGGGSVDFDEIVAAAGETTKPTHNTAPMLIGFASLAMPPDSLRQMITDISRAGGMVVFRGFSANGPKVFSASLRQILPPGGEAHISIDPRLFRAYHIEAVPTYVAASSGFELCAGEDCESAVTPHDRLAGNVTTHYALETFAQGNGPGAPVARVALANMDRAQ